MLGKSLGYGGDTAPVGAAMEGQRLLSTKSPREASKMYLWTVGLLFLMLTMLTLPGLGALALRPELYEASAAEREAVFGWLLGHYMPPGLLGLALVALFAAIMSTVDSNMNLGAQVDIIAPNKMIRIPPITGVGIVCKNAPSLPTKDISTAKIAAQVMMAGLNAFVSVTAPVTSE